MKTRGTPTTTTAGAPPPASTDATNPYFNRNIYRNPVYALDIFRAASNLGNNNQSLRDAYTAVSQVPTFIWLNSTAKAAALNSDLQQAQTNNEVLQIVLYDIPNRDYRFEAPGGDFTYANLGHLLYNNWVDSIVSAISEYPSVTVVAIIEPNSLANVVAYSNGYPPSYFPDYQFSVVYAIQQLSTLGNVHIYIDAGNAGSIDQPALRSSLASLLDSVYVQAGSPPNVRGLATNVANYNFLTATTPDPVAGNNPVYDELLYIQALAPLLQHVPRHFIVDQSRSGVADIRPAGWISWCNLAGAGFGPRPTTNTPSPLIDAIVWVKEGGYSDDTSDPNSPKWQPFCSLVGSTGGAPDYNVFWPGYFSSLLFQANPSFL